MGFIRVIKTMVNCWKSRTTAVAILALAMLCSMAANAQNTFKIGLVVPMTGRQASSGREIEAAIRLYMARHGNMVAGKQIKIIVKDDGAIPDITRRVAQELIVGEKVNALLGFGITPSVYAVAPLLTEARIPGIVMAAGASDVTGKSPYILRTGFTMAQSSTVIAAWAAANGIRTVVTIVSDYSPGHDAQGSFKERFLAGGGRVLEEIKVPVANPDFAPFLQRVRETSPDAVFVFVPSGQVMFLNQFAECGLDKAGIKIIGPGDITDDDQLPSMRDSVIGTITAHMYSASHPSKMNLDYVSDFERSNNFRPNFMSVAGYDGMHLVYEALRKTGGTPDGDVLVAAMKGMTWESPRGSISIDPYTRDIVQNIYIRRVERVNGSLYNSEFATFEAVKDPRTLER